MKIFVVLPFLLLLQLDTFAQVDSAKEKLLAASFTRFFDLDDGDTAQLAKKLKIGGAMIDLCTNGNYTSKYCTYVSLWANIIRKDFDVADRELSDLEKKYPDWAEVYFLRAQYLHYKEADGAIESLQQCLELNPKLVPPYYYLGVLYYEMKNYRLSVKYYDLLEKIAPDHPSLYYNRANVKSELQDYDGAVADYTTDVQKFPDHFKSWFNRARLYLQLKEYNKAESDLTTFLKLYPGYSSGFYYRGVARYFLGNFDKACEDFRTAAQMGNQTAAQYAAQNCK